MLYPEGNRANNAYMTRKQVNRGNPELSKGEDEISFEDLLVDVGQNQNKESFIQLFEHFAPRIKSFLIKGGANESNADELAQETMLNVWKPLRPTKIQIQAIQTFVLFMTETILVMSNASFLNHVLKPLQRMNRRGRSATSQVKFKVNKLLLLMMIAK